MLEKLAENSHKGSWKGMTIPEVMGRIREEMEELELDAADLIVAEKYGTDDAQWLEKKRRDMAREAADVANYLMALCDVTGMLEEGR